MMQSLNIEAAVRRLRNGGVEEKPAAAIADLVADVVRPLATRDDLHAAEIRVIGAVAAMLTVAVLILSFT